MKDKNFCSWEDAVVWLKEQSDRQELVKACFFDDPLEESMRLHYCSSGWRESGELWMALKSERPSILAPGEEFHPAPWQWTDGA
jgi:hypothetical protein